MKYFEILKVIILNVFYLMNVFFFIYIIYIILIITNLKNKILKNIYKE